jgi:2,3,4,5-tetrahydropyridine-2-carboxylate N-succinyltransferase
MTLDLQTTIEHAWEDRASLSPQTTDATVREAIEHAIDALDQGTLRVAEKIGADWVVHQWLKKAVLLSFRINDNEVMGQAPLEFFDKVPLKFSGFGQNAFNAGGYRVVPPAVVRRGAFIGKNVVLMPSYVNIGAYVDEGTMVDTWATVGSCAQIGKNVHLSGGVGIGGVLEPLQANPTIIEDNCFIGARSEVVEGVVVEANSVLAMGVFLSQSTRIYDRETGEISFGRVPSGSVVVPGSLPAADGSHSLACAVIVKKVDAQTRAKTSINDLLRA